MTQPSGTSPNGALGGREAIDRFQRTIDDLEKRMVDHSRQLAQAQDVGALLKEVTGIAESEDGHVRVEYTGQGLHDLVINPRAMRLGSEELAVTIKETIAAASADYQQHVMSALREAGFTVSPDEQQREVESAVGRLDDAQRDFTSSLRSAAELMGRAQQARETLR